MAEQPGDDGRTRQARGETPCQSPEDGGGREFDQCGGEHVVPTPQALDKEGGAEDRDRQANDEGQPQDELRLPAPTRLLTVNQMLADLDPGCRYCSREDR